MGLWGLFLGRRWDLGLGFLAVARVCGASGMVWMGLGGFDGVAAILDGDGYSDVGR